MVFGAYVIISFWQFGNTCGHGAARSQAPVTSPAIRSTWRSWPRRRWAPVSASCGGTPARRRSSWATPARWRIGGAFAAHGDRHPHRTAAGRARRPVRRRDGVGDPAGRLVQDDPETGVQHGADPSPLRAGRAGRRRPSSSASGSSAGSPSPSGSGCSTPSSSPTAAAALSCSGRRSRPEHRGRRVDWPACRSASSGSGCPARPPPGASLRLGAVVTVARRRQRRAAAGRRRPGCADAGRRGRARRAAHRACCRPGSTSSSPRPACGPTTPLLRRGRRSGIEVWGEVELAWRLQPPDQRWLAVTGTNGKTTTTQMLGAILAAAGRRSTTAGNIGAPLLDAVTRRRRRAPRVSRCSRSSCPASSCTTRSTLLVRGRRGAEHGRRTTSTGTGRRRPTPPTRPRVWHVGRGRDRQRRRRRQHRDLAGRAHPA